MKARLIETGEWLTVNPCDDGFYDVETHNIYDADELDFSRGFDWEIFRGEAAKDFVVALISSGNGLNPKNIAYSIEMADELIKQLREDKK